MDWVTLRCIVTNVEWSSDWSVVWTAPATQEVPVAWVIEDGEVIPWN